MFAGTVNGAVLGAPKQEPLSPLSPRASGAGAAGRVAGVLEHVLVSMPSAMTYA